MADILVTAAQDELRNLPWDDVIAYDLEESHADAVSRGTEQRRAVYSKYESVSVRSLP